MGIAVSSIASKKVSSGLCPHGLPVGACPICSGMGGGSRLTKADFSAKPGEMSWNECAAIGAYLRSLKNARMAQNNDYQNRIIAMLQFQNNMAKMSANLQNFINSMAQSPITKPLAFVAKNIMLPVVNFIKNLPVKFLQMTGNLAQKLTDISDKLVAMYGELKAAINKKISDISKKIKKKILSLFEIFTADNDDSENEMLEYYQKQLDKIKSFFKNISDNTNLMIQQTIEIEGNKEFYNE